MTQFFTIQTFSDYAKRHPHIYAIVTDGLFRRNGVSHVMPRVSNKPLAELFRASVLVMLKKEGLINDASVAMIIKWRHTSDFSVDNSVRLARDDKIGITNLAQYIMRSPFSLAKLNNNHENGMVLYRSKMSLVKARNIFLSLQQ